MPSRRILLWEILNAAELVIVEKLLQMIGFTFMMDN